MLKSKQTCFNFLLLMYDVILKRTSFFVLKFFKKEIFLLKIIFYFYCKNFALNEFFVFVLILILFLLIFVSLCFYAFYKLLMFSVYLIIKTGKISFQ